MHRPWSARVLHALIAIWFVLSVGEPSVAHFCPMHGGTLAELAGAHDMPGMPAVHTSHQVATHPHGHTASHHCSCISCCVGAGGAALRSADVAVVAAWTIGVHTMPTTADVLPRPAPFLPQPFGTGPPRV